MWPQCKWEGYHQKNYMDELTETGTEELKKSESNSK
jgi:hypothetical protein